MLSDACRFGRLDAFDMHYAIPEWHQGAASPGNAPPPSSFRMPMFHRDTPAQVYDQFMANIIANNLTQRVLPFSTTSILGARWIELQGAVPDVIFLDSAHEIDETRYELELYYALLRPGGVLFGDDFIWPAVRHDVCCFLQDHGLPLLTDVRYSYPRGNIWWVQKPPKPPLR